MRLVRSPVSLVPRLLLGGRGLGTRLITSVPHGVGLTLSLYILVSFPDHMYILVSFPDHTGEK